ILRGALCNLHWPDYCYGDRCRASLYTGVSMVTFRHTGLLIGHSGLLIGALSLSVSGLWHPAEAAAVQFVPPRAVYDIILHGPSPGSGITDMTGRMVYELVGDEGAGYSQKMRFVTRITGRDGEAQVNDLRSTTWEQAEGQKLRF